jgi:hypothetical protein
MIRTTAERLLKFLTAVICLATFATSVRAADSGGPLLLNAKPVHLGTAGKAEWEDFAGRTPDGPRLDLRFGGRTNEREATLFIRQDDVRQDWIVELNGKRLGSLFLMEADLVHSVVLDVTELAGDGD